MEFHQRGNKLCQRHVDVDVQGRYNSMESKFSMNKSRLDSRPTTGDMQEKDMKMKSLLRSENDRNHQFNVEGCKKMDFSDPNFIDQYIQKLERKMCSLESSVSETNINIRSVEIEENSYQKFNCDREVSLQEMKKQYPNPNKLRYDEKSMGNPCSPDKFAYTLKARDWEAEYEEMMHKEMPPIDFKALGLPPWPGGCAPPPSDEYQQPKCQMKLPPLRKEEIKKPHNDEINRMIAECNRMKKCADAPPLPPKWRTAPSYSFLYEDTPLELTLLSKKSFDEE